MFFIANLIRFSQRLFFKIFSCDRMLEMFYSKKEDKKSFQNPPRHDFIVIDKNDA